jgi:hypothetical protein
MNRTNVRANFSAKLTLIREKLCAYSKGSSSAAPPPRVFFNNFDAGNEIRVCSNRRSQMKNNPMLWEGSSSGPKQSGDLRESASDHDLTLIEGVDLDEGQTAILFNVIRDRYDDALLDNE